MSTSTTTNGSDGESDFLFLEQAAQIDGVSVSVEDEQFVATCEEQSEGKIDTSKVHDVAERAGLQVINTIADFDAGTVRVFVTRARGDGE